MSNKPYNAEPGKPAEINITATRDDTFLFKLTAYNSDGTPYDFTGHTFKLQVKEKREEGETPVIDIPDGDFTITQNQQGIDAGVNNVISIEHAASNMDVKPKDYVYDLEMTDAVGKIQTIVKEKDHFRVEQDVSE